MAPARRDFTLVICAMCTYFVPSPPPPFHENAGSTLATEFKFFTVPSNKKVILVSLQSYETDIIDMVPDIPVALRFSTNPLIIQ